MRRHGLDDHIVEALGSVASILRGLGAPVDATRRLAHGGLIDAGSRRLRVLHRPGHSPADTLFHDEEAGVLLCGDHLLSTISSNALITGTWEGGDEVRTRALLDYRRWLMATHELELKVTLSGHGSPITDHRTLTSHRLGRQRRKAERLYELLALRPLTAHELAKALYSDVAFTQGFLTLSEVLGHLDLLIHDGIVASDNHGGRISFRAI